MLASASFQGRNSGSLHVMPGLDPGIRVFLLDDW
jgi:hypothetical protein